MVTVSVSNDGSEVVLSNGESSDCELRLDAAGVSRLISDLANARVEISPAFSGSFTSGKTEAFECDNLIWASQPDPTRRGISLALQHPGLGWLRLRLSRAQAEDLITSIQFSLIDLLRIPGLQGLRTLPDAEDALQEEPCKPDILRFVQR